MDFELKGEYLLVQKMAREFAEKEIKPLAATLDEEERFPVESIPKLTKCGFFSAPYPKEYGGHGGDYMAYVIALEEIAKVCATTAVIISVHSSIGINLFIKHGTKAQQEKYLPMLTKGGKLAGFALTESEAGTDSSGIKTKADEKDDTYILNGTKMFITSAGYNEVYVVLAVTDKYKGTNGVTAFIVHKDNPGLKIGKRERKMGIRGSATSELIFENCIVSKNDILGKVGNGLKIALSGLDNGRIGIATQALGIAQGALDETYKYVRERKQFGKRISEFQNTQFVLAELQTKVDAARLLVWRAASMKDAGKNINKESAMAKLYASDVANIVTRECVQMLGGYGYTREYPVERMMRDAKITEIYEGTSQAQKIVISRALNIK